MSIDGLHIERKNGMEIRIEDITHENLDMLFDWSVNAKGTDIGCRFCLYWEEPDRNKWPESHELRQNLKCDRLKEAEVELGICAKVGVVDSDVVGYVHFARSKYLPNTKGYDCGPPSEEAIFIACLYVPVKRGEGVGCALLNSVIEELKLKNVSALETYALKGSANNPSGPLNFWLKNGFRVIREDRLFALVRKEL